jgi:hypothetical protein
MIASAMILIGMFSENSSVPSIDKVIKQLQAADVDFAQDARGNIAYLGAGLTDEAIRLVAPFGTLIELDCTGTKVTDDGLAHLKGSKSLRKLRARCAITGKGIAHLEGCPSLEYLVVEPKVDAESTVRSIGKLRQLKVLYLYGDAEFRPEWFDGWKHLQLREFVTEMSRVGDEHVTRLEPIQSLERVVLGDTRITDASMDSLLKLKRIRQLSLGDTAISDNALGRLRTHPSLEFLSAGRTKISNRGVADVCECRTLRTLYVRDTAIDDGAIEALSRARQLQSMDITGTRFTKSGVTRLKAALPKCEISSDFDE